MYTALVVCNGPLLYDFTIVYKGSLDGTVLVFVIATGKVNKAYPFLKFGRNLKLIFIVGHLGFQPILSAQSSTLGVIYFLLVA